ncbi:putative heavy metal transport/detoxification protein [Methanocella paludicola SANAE]|uniref:Heavy metal transport/detoxification protein n=1 Tax=Methanocella paludicola (strain DSM 17711 / JCM 13418 / NBRC 101707 / SANAE) TaxID=304371 RepID=D1YXF6_METPS|nr:heavy metal-associated domain-containing protein [Methanocella paludicola]BAI61128.1 putative heavy metal transport/detoxification protein [Methanocella paludicola SANAE]
MEGKEQKKVVLLLDGLSCPDCAAKIGAVLKNSKGVSGVEVLYMASKVKVDYDPAVTNVENFVSLIEKLGYGVKSTKPLN